MSYYSVFIESVLHTRVVGSIEPQCEIDTQFERNIGEDLFISVKILKYTF